MRRWPGQIATKSGIGGADDPWLRRLVRARLAADDCRLPNHDVGNARDLTLTALSSHTVFDSGIRRALAQWQIETAQALSLNAAKAHGLTV